MNLTCYLRCILVSISLCFATNSVATDIPIVTGLMPVFGSAGDNVVLEPNVYGPGPFKYQWFKDGEVVESATSRDLSVDSISWPDVGLYYLRVTNLYGSGLSNEVGVVLVGDIGDALDTDGIVWEYAGTHPFIVDTDERYFNGDALISYPVSGNALVDAVLKTTLEGPKVLSFNLRQESEFGYREAFAVYIDGEFDSWFWPTDEWRRFYVGVESGEHTIEIAYDRAWYSYPNEYQNHRSLGIRSWIDSVAFEEKTVILEQPRHAVGINGDSIDFKVTAIGDEDISYQWYRGDGTVIENATGAVYSLPFNWGESELGDYYVVVESSFGVSTSEVATLELGSLHSQSTNLEGIDFIPADNQDWYLDYSPTDPSDLVLRTESSSSLSDASMAASIVGPTNLVFDWMIEKREFGDDLVVSIDGVDISIISSVVDLYIPKWREYAVRIPEGEHVVAWRFANRAAVVPNPSVAWINNIRTTVAPRIMASSVNGKVLETEPLSIRVEVVGEYPMTYQWFKDGDFLDGQVGGELHIEVSDTGNTGEYFCVVTDASGRIGISDTEEIEVVGGISDALNTHYINRWYRYESGIAPSSREVSNLGDIIEVKERFDYDLGLTGDSHRRAKLRIKVEGVNGDPVSIRSGGSYTYWGNSDWVEIFVPMGGDTLLFDDVVSRDGTGEQNPVWGHVTIDHTGIITNATYGASLLTRHKVGEFIFDDSETPTMIIGVSGWHVFLQDAVQGLIELKRMSLGGGEAVTVDAIELAVSSDFFYRMFTTELDAEYAIRVDGTAVQDLLIDQGILTWPYSLNAHSVVDSIVETFPRDFEEAEALMGEIQVPLSLISVTIPKWKYSFGGASLYPYNGDARVLIDWITYDDSPYVEEGPLSISGPIGAMAVPSIGARGYGPIEFALWKDGVPFSELNRSFQVVDEIRADNSGIYQLQVGDGFGNTFSKPSVIAYDSGIGSVVGMPGSRMWSSGDKLWMEETQDWVVGGSSLAVGSLSEGDSSSLFLELEGPAELQFRWKSDYDFVSQFTSTRFSLYMDDELLDSMSEATWRKKSVLIPAGSHIFEWRADLPTGSDHSSRSLVDAIRIVRDGQEGFADWALREIPFDVFSSFDNLSEIQLGDQDNDEIPNFMEYAFGSDSESYDSSPEVKIDLDELGWSVSSTMPWRDIAVEADVGLQISYDLESWYTVKSSYTRRNGEMTVYFGGYQIVSPPPQFARLVYYNLSGVE